MPKRILIVDDSLFVRTIIKKVLSQDSEFCIVGEATSGKEAVDLAERLKPDIITMDVTMPDMSGLEASKVILGRANNTKIVLLTALGCEDVLVQAKEIGIKHFLPKPFQPEQLLQVLRDL